MLKRTFFAARAGKFEFGPATVKGQFVDGVDMARKQYTNRALVAVASAVSVEAVLPASGQVVGRAHGDDRGEFLLLIGSESIPVGDLVNPLPLRVRIFGPAAPPVPATPDLPLQDPLWDLPLETVPAPGVADTVSTGETLPAGYTANVTANVDFFLGELRSGPAAFTVV